MIFILFFSLFWNACIVSHESGKRPEISSYKGIYEIEGKSTQCEIDEKEPSNPEAQEKKPNLYVQFGDSSFELTNRLRLDNFYSVNLRLLNNQNNEGPVQLDKVAWPGRHILDSWFMYTYGKETYGSEVVRFRLGLRNRGIWGDEESILKTTFERIRHVDHEIGNHRHAIPRHILWARELWLEIALGDLFDIPTKHSFTMGLFPFELGRGIALGQEYDVDRQLLSDDPSLAIDQYAPGMKLSGEIIAPCVLNYDFYFEIARNLSSSFDLVNEPIYEQAIGRRFDPARGFGSFDYFIAGRILWKPCDEVGDRVSLEPYGLYSFSREQRIIFPAQSQLRMGTFGLAGEFEQGDWEWGFDTAFNTGVTRVLGWDYNIIKEANRDSFDVFEYTRIVDADPADPNAKPQPIPVTNKTQKIVNGDLKEGERFNGQQIGQIDAGGIVIPLFNAENRFNNCFDVFLKGGAMFVCDAAYTFRPCNIKIAGTAGFATGDRDPFLALAQKKIDTHNVTFKGFIPQQELYQGKRVRSILFLAGPGPIPRPLVGAQLTSNPEALGTLRTFNNVILTGASCESWPCFGSWKFHVKSNLLGFWTYIQERVPTRDTIPAHDAGRYFGTEWNLTIETFLFTDLKMFAYGAVFFPGSFYESIAGLPFNTRSKRFVFSDDLLREGERIPRLGSDPAYYFNIGFEYRF